MPSKVSAKTIKDSSKDVPQQGLWLFVAAARTGARSCFLLMQPAAPSCLVWLVTPFRDGDRREGVHRSGKKTGSGTQKNTSHVTKPFCVVRGKHTGMTKGKRAVAVTAHSPLLPLTADL